MDREELNALVQKGPIRIRMNDGEVCDVPSPDRIVVSDITASVLYLSEPDGKWRHKFLQLASIADVEEIEETIHGEMQVSKEDLEMLLRKQPFTPFRLHFSNGASHDVTHPDNVLVSTRMAAVAVGDSIWTVALAHVVEVEPLSSVRA